MKILLRIPQPTFQAIHQDLSRRHAHAAERVGFLVCGVGQLDKDDLLLLGDTYHPVADDHYLDDKRVGAMMSSAAIRTALELAYGRNIAMFHIHRHEHKGRPKFSRVDEVESAKFVPDFFKVRRNMPHGAIVLSRDSATGLCWLPGSTKPVPIDQFVVVSGQVPGLRSLV